jgi:hypothetical protein
VKNKQTSGGQRRWGRIERKVNYERRKMVGNFTRRPKDGPKRVSNEIARLMEIKEESN